MTKRSTMTTWTRTGLLLGLFTAMAGTAGGFTHSEGNIKDRHCDRYVFIVENGGEVYVVKRDGLPESDWQLSTVAKGGPMLGMRRIQTFGGNYEAHEDFRRPSGPNDLVSFAVTFPDGRIARSGGFARSPYDGHTNAQVQVVGNSLLRLSDTAGILLPDRIGTYTATVDGTETVYPRRVPSGLEVAFAPLLDQPGSAWMEVDFDVVCHAVGVGSEPQDRTAAPEWRGMIVGYNVYRLPDAGARPSREELGRPENWIYFVPVEPGLEVPDDLHVELDPDGLPSSGDEVVVFHDLQENRDGSPRELGTGPEPGLDYWYAFQPVAPGSIDDWSDIAIDQRMSPEWELYYDELYRWDMRVDSDGDGLFDSVNVSTAGDPSAETDGPEFVSPQAEAGLPGLGLTNGGIPVLSPLVSTAEVAEAVDAESCANGSDDDGDGFVDCDDPECFSEEDCEGPGGTIITLPGGSPEVVVGWDQTLGDSPQDVWVGSLAALLEGRFEPAPAACGVTGGRALLPRPAEDSYFLRSRSIPSGHDVEPWLGRDSLGRARTAATLTCP